MSIRDFKNRVLLFNIFFLSLGGYYAILILVTNLLSNNFSRYVTIPIRILVVFSIILLFFSKPFRGVVKKDVFYFLLFAIVYIAKIFSSSFTNIDLYMPLEQFFLYFLSFVFLPFLLLNDIKFSNKDYEKISYLIIFGTVVVSLLTFFYYGDLLGEVDRISQEISHDENYISPLSLSYTSILGIGVCISLLFTKKLTLFKKILLYCAIFICLIPFYLGASRGSIISFLLIVLLYFTVSKNTSRKLKSILILSAILLFISFSSIYLGSGVFDRFLGISSGIESNSSSSIRLLLWKDAINQYLADPAWGGSLQLETAKHYPHNIFIEVLMSTGVFGLIPLVVFIYLIFKKAIKIIRYEPQMFWITNLFLVAFGMNMFSGAIWGASWLALGAALISGYKLDNKHL